MIENSSLPTADYSYAPTEEREWSLSEKRLLPAALLIGVLFDLLISEPNYWVTRMYAGIFWLCYLVIFYVMFWKRLLLSKPLWFIAGCSVTLCVWNFFFQVNNEEYGFLTYLVIPAVLMAHAQFLKGEYKLKEAGSFAAAWVSGWLIKPFSGLPALFGVIGSLLTSNGLQMLKRIALGVLFALILLYLIVPLLCGADQVFGYYLDLVVDNLPILDLFTLFEHTVITLLAFALFYSFLWNVGFGTKGRVAAPIELTIETVISGVVLSSLALLYCLFCIIQFTYLFAGAGLPAGMTYSAYAREGFAQTVDVCGINLFIFGVILHLGARNKFITVMLAALIVFTSIILVSGFVRLYLYIDAYGLTWLRLLSIWFIFYLAVVILLCTVRMLQEKLPLIAMCAMLLLGWYVVLGYSNPDTLIMRYNKSHSFDITINKPPF